MDTGTLINNRYKVIRPLGKGGMGIIYLVVDTLKADMPFAVKTVRQDILTKAKDLGINSIKNEYEIMTGLKHPNLVQIHDYGTDNDDYYIVLEYVDGDLLSDISASEMGLAGPEIFEIIVQISRALGFLHSREIIYRDIKPSNIIITNKQAKLLDFGLSDLEYKKEDKIKGTIKYLAPEVLFGEIDYSMDIFSLGLVFYELVAKENFYAEYGPKEIIGLLKDQHKYQAYQQRKIKMIEHAGPSSIISKMTSYHTSDRYNTPAEIIFDINRNFNLNHEYETIETRQSYVLGNSFVNRKKEMAELKKFINKTNIPKMFIYGGPQGVGKTRLFMEFKKFCRLNEIPFYETSCTEGTTGHYHCFMDILKQIVSDTNDMLIKKYVPALKLILPELSISENQNLDTKLKKEIIINNVSAFLLDFSLSIKKNIILYINDIQWIDEGSSEILHSLLHLLKIKNNEEKYIKIFASINMQTAIEGRPVLNLLSNDHIIKKDLLPFNTSDVRDYITKIFGSKYISTKLKKLAKDAHERVGGNPFFLNELLSSLISSGHISKERKSWTIVKDRESIPIPDNLIEITERRLKALFSDANIKLLLQTLSLIRIGINISDLMTITGKDNSANIPGLLSYLEKIEIIRSYRSKNQLYVKFQSNLTRDIIKKTIHEHILLNRSIAEKMTIISKQQDTDNYTEEIAHHFFESKDFVNSALYFIKSGDIYQKAYYHKKAISYYEKALKIMERSETAKRIETKLKIAKGMGSLQEWESAKAILEECILSNIYPEKAYNQLGKIHLECSEYQKALKAFSISMDLSKDLNEELYYETLLQMANLNINTADFDKAIFYLNEYEAYCKKSGNKKGIAYAAGRFGIINLCRNDYEGAMEYFNKSKGICEELGDIYGLSYALNNMGNAYTYQRKYKMAMECFKEKMRLSKRIGDKKEIANALGNMGMVYAEQQNLSKAKKCFEINHKISYQIRDKKGLMVVLLNMGNISIHEQNYEKALEIYKESEDLCMEIGHKLGLEKVLHNIGVTCFNLGKLQEAIRYFKKKIALSTEMKNPYEISAGHENLAQFYYCMKDYENAYKHVNNALKLNENMPSNKSYFYLNVFKALLLLGKGQINEAQKTIDKTMEIFETGMDYDILFAKRVKAKILGFFEPQNAFEQLNVLLLESDNDEFTAEVLTDIYLITRKKKYLSSAKEKYSKLLRNTKSRIYERKIKDLEKLSF